MEPGTKQTRAQLLTFLSAQPNFLEQHHFLAVSREFVQEGSIDTDDEFEHATVSMTLPSPMPSEAGGVSGSVASEPTVSLSDDRFGY